MSEKKTNKTDGNNLVVEKYLKEADDDEESAEEEDVQTGANAQSLGIRAQKKLLGRFSSKSVAKVFIDETSGRILDNLHKLVKNFSGNKKEADKILKGIIKTIVKLGILYKNEIFNAQELKSIEDFRRRFHSLAKSVVTFYEVDFTFDYHFLSRMCRDCQELTHKIISTHLTNKSHSRIDYVYNTLSSTEFLEYAFDSTSPINRAIIKDIVQDMNALMDSGML